jgi:hypothetical protein
MKASCLWVTDAGICGAKVGYKMVWDGGEVGTFKVRQYNPFCDHHMIEAAKEDKEYENGDLDNDL